MYSEWPASDGDLKHGIGSEKTAAQEAQSDIEQLRQRMCRVDRSASDPARVAPQQTARG